MELATKSENDFYRVKMCIKGNGLIMLLSPWRIILMVNKEIRPVPSTGSGQVKKLDRAVLMMTAVLSIEDYNDHTIVRTQKLWRIWR